MKFKYLGDTYTTERKTFDFCMKRNLLRRLLASSIPDSTQKGRKSFFILSIDDPEFRWFCAYSTNPKYYKKFQHAYKHLEIKNLTTSQCKFLEKITKGLEDFRDAIKLSKEAVETIYEIS